MQTCAELYTRESLLTATAPAEPCAILIENTEEYFGLLLAESCLQDSWSGTLSLQSVVHFRATRRHALQQRHDEVRLAQDGGLYVLREIRSGNILPNRSRRPYTICFMPAGDHEELHWHLGRGKGSALFRWAQLRYGALPGFAAVENALSAPDDYAGVPLDPGTAGYLKYVG